MEHEDGRIPVPRRAGRPLFRRSPPAPAPAPRVADLSALLADIDALRTTLSTDLTLAAAALEAGADDLAGALVDGDLSAVRSFEARAMAHLSALDSPAAAPVQAAPVVAAPVVATPVVVPIRRKRLLAAAPLLAAAAAVVGLFAGVVPASTPVPTTSATIDGLSQANYSLAMLSELASQGASTSELRDAARQLNEELAELVADAEGDPLAAQQALLLLQESSQVLNDQDAGGALSDVLARTRELQAALRRVLPTPRQVAAPLRTLPVAPAAASPKAAPRQTKAASSRPSASASPVTSASPTPSTAPSTPASTPAPSGSSTPSPSSSPTAADPFPRPPGLPG